jgi:hypothetical protein
MSKFADGFVWAPHLTVSGWFERMASKTAHLSGKPVTFLLAALIVVIWARDRGKCYIRTRNFRAIHRVPVPAAALPPQQTLKFLQSRSLSSEFLIVYSSLGGHGGEQLRDMSAQHSRKIVDLL